LSSAKYSKLPEVAGLSLSRCTLVAEAAAATATITAAPFATTGELRLGLKIEQVRPA